MNMRLCERRCSTWTMLLCSWLMHSESTMMPGNGWRIYEMPYVNKLTELVFEHIQDEAVRDQFLDAIDELEESYEQTILNLEDAVNHLGEN